MLFNVFISVQGRREQTVRKSGGEAGFSQGNKAVDR